MIGRALDTGTPARWVAGDEVYGDNPHLRADLEERRTGYVLAVSSTHQVIMAAGKFPAKVIAAKIPKRAWQRRSVGVGAKGERYYDWAQADIQGPADRLGHWWLLARRNRRTGELAFYRCFSPHPVPLSDLIRVAGRRWTIEETFQAGKGLPAWTNTRSAAGPPGTAGSPSRCSPTPSSLSPRLPNAAAPPPTT